MPAVPLPIEPSARRHKFHKGRSTPDGGADGLAMPQHEALGPPCKQDIGQVGTHDQGGGDE